LICKFKTLEKMTEELIIAGFGGQGVLSMGKILCYSGIVQGQEVTWMPSYGPEMRGGTANVTVILSDERISSPIVGEFDTAIILNQQSMDKFEKTVKKGGTLIYDSNGITRHPERKDINVYRVDAAEEAAKMDSTKTFNMIVLGGYLKIKPIVKMENVVAGIKKSLPERYHHLVAMNEKAIVRGTEIVTQIQKV
jgi:2-oxoglutarate ferredoxin oxidoreductase subunit gamma